MSDYRPFFHQTIVIGMPFFFFFNVTIAVLKVLVNQQIQEAGGVTLGALKTVTAPH